MKIFFTVFILFAFVVVNAYCEEEEEYDNYQLYPSLKFIYERVPEYNRNNLCLDLSACSVNESSGWSFSGFSLENCNRVDFDYFNVDLLRFGLNLKTNDYKKYDCYFGFSLMKALGYMNNSRCNNTILRFNFNIINLSSDLIYNKNYEWINFNLGYGYDFWGKLGKHLMTSIYGGITYNYFSLDNIIFYKISNSNLKFSAFQFLAGSELKLVFFPIEFSLDANYSLPINSTLKNKMIISSKFKYMHQKRKQYLGIDYVETYLKKYFDIYVSCDYNRFSISDFNQEIFRFSAGIDVFFNHPLDSYLYRIGIH